MQESKITEKTHIQPRWLTIVRIILGLVLIYKGILFIKDTTLLQKLVEETGIGVFSKYADALAFIIAYLSVLCGLFIACGLWTKISSIVQIPILIIAVFFVNIHRIDSSSFELVLSLFTLILLFVFAVKGSGTLSADEFFQTYYKAGSEDGQTKRFFKF
jgi:uncharacterized membrane protein YphA (DoxX/SURF4 family)